MIFKSWRDEKTDLIDKYITYGEHYLILQESIEEQINLFAVCNEELSNIEDQMTGFDKYEDQFDLNAPTTQDFQHEDEAEGSEDLHPDLSDNTGIPYATSNVEPLVLNEMPDNDCKQLSKKRTSPVYTKFNN